jgi:hypothetical protein
MSDTTTATDPPPAVERRWESCRIGSCQRHQDCMYQPCRAAVQVPAVERRCGTCHWWTLNTEPMFRHVGLCAPPMPTWSDLKRKMTVEGNGIDCPAYQPKGDQS